MNKYEVIHLVKDMDNLDKIQDIFSRWYFQTSVITPKVKQGMIEGAKEIAKMGEMKVYKHVKDVYKLKT